MAIPIIGDIIGAVKDVVGEVVVDKDKKNQINYELQRLEVEMEDKEKQRATDERLAQIEVNKTEASSANLFVSGWRPAVGWICVISMAWSFTLLPFCSFIARTVFGYTGDFPSIDMDAFMFILAGILGLGGMKTFEKVKGVSSNTLHDNEKATRNVPRPTVVFAEPKEVVQAIPEDAPWAK